MPGGTTYGEKGDKFLKDLYGSSFTSLEKLSVLARELYTLGIKVETTKTSTEQEVARLEWKLLEKLGLLQEEPIC